MDLARRESSLFSYGTRPSAKARMAVEADQGGGAWLTS